MPQIGREAGRVIARLAAIDRARPTLDRERVETALTRHFVEVGMPPLPLRWVRDAEEGFLAAAGAAKSTDWIWLDRVAGMWVEEVERYAGAAAGAKARAAAWPQAEAVAKSLAGWQAWTKAGRWARVRSWSPPESAPRSAALSAARAASWLEAPHDPEIAGLVGGWLPFLVAAEAGLWVYWVLRDEVVTVPRPALRIEEGRLHAENGPAVSWPGGARYWMWRGVQVPRRVIEAPERITVGAIRRETNAEVRRVMLERYGHERYLHDMGAEKVHSDDFGTLWRAPVPGDEPLVMVEVVDASPKPDGTFRNYLIRVPPTMRTAKEAVAWTFGKHTPEYHLDFET